MEIEYQIYLKENNDEYKEGLILYNNKIDKILDTPSNIYNPP